MPKWFRDPPHLLLILWAVAVEATVIAFALSKVYADWTLVYTLGFASATAVAGTDLALWVQAYYSKLSEERQFRQEIEVRWFESIYAPLYEDAKQAVDAAEDYRVPWFTKWDEIRASRFGPFVEPDILEGLDRAKLEFQTYYQQWQEGHSRAEDIITDHLRAVPSLAEFVDNIKGNLTTWLSGDNHFIFDAAKSSPTEYTTKQFTQAVIGIFRGRPEVRAVLPTGDDINVWFQAIKARLKEDAKIQTVSQQREVVLATAKAIQERVLGRMRHPFQ